MNTDDLNFAYRVRHALNENLDNLPVSTTARLAAARQMALSRKKNSSPLRAFVPQNVLTTQAGNFFHEPLSWFKSLGVVLPLLALVVGLVGIYQFEQQQRISEIAELDVAVLSDELPPSAYLDHGFNAYLASRGE